MTRVTPEQAAKQLARHIKLPSWRGSVLVSGHGSKAVLVVAAEPQWRSQADIPSEFFGFPVEQDNQLIGLAYG